MLTLELGALFFSQLKPRLMRPNAVSCAAPVASAQETAALLSQKRHPMSSIPPRGDCSCHARRLAPVGRACRDTCTKRVLARGQAMSRQCTSETVFSLG